MGSALTGRVETDFALAEIIGAEGIVLFVPRIGKGETIATNAEMDGFREPALVVGKGMISRFGCSQAHF